MSETEALTESTESTEDVETSAAATDRAEAPAEGDAERIARLEQEGDIAADYLEELLDIADLDGDLDIDVEVDRAAVSIVGADLSQLVGPDGKVLEALQELTRTAVQRRLRSRARLLVDIESYRSRRRSSLAEYARAMAQRAKERGTEIELEAMNSFERKIVHDAVAEIEGSTSFSEGEEPNRKVVIRGE